MVNLFRPDTWRRRGENGASDEQPSARRVSSKGPQPRSTATPVDGRAADLRESIQELAYFKWKLAGCPEGQDERFWLEAEREILARR